MDTTLVKGSQLGSRIAGAFVFEKTKSSFQLSRNGGVAGVNAPARSSETSSVQLPNAFSPTNGFSVSSGRKYASCPALIAVTCTVSSNTPFVVKERNSNDVTGVSACRVIVFVIQPAPPGITMFVATTPLVRTETTGGFGGLRILSRPGSREIRKLSRY